MRPRFVIFILALATVILAIILWWRPSRRPSSVMQPQATTQPKTAVNVNVANQSPPGIRQPTAPTSVKQSAANRMSLPQVVEKAIEMNNQPIDFYGEVIDQNSNALSGVDVKVTVRHWTVMDPTAVAYGLGSKEIPIDRVTTADGRFEISGVTGDAFDLKSIQKDGYDPEPGRRTFGSSGGSYDSPVIFKMWPANVREQLITAKRAFPIIPDGRPYVINLSQGTIAESGAGDLRVWVKRPEPITSRRYDWSCGVDAINGGGLLQETDLSAAMYQAPTTGYTASFDYQENATANGWGDTTGPQRFYVRLNNGQEYGEITIELEADYNSQIPSMIRLSYAINPSGSRVLR